jgi:hypothetical protein
VNWSKETAGLSGVAGPVGPDERGYRRMTSSPDAITIDFRTVMYDPRSKIRPADNDEGIDVRRLTGAGLTVLTCTSAAHRRGQRL